MTVSVANTNLSHSFETWRQNTNTLATVMSNNVVTVSRAGSAERGGSAKGNGHVSGTFSATNLRTTTLRGGNTTSDGALTIASNTSLNGTTVTINANTVLSGNVTVSTSGPETFNLGDVSRLRLTGGSQGQVAFKDGSGIGFATLNLRQIQDLSSNSAHLILSAANTTFSDNGDTPHLKFAGITDSVDVFLAADAIFGQSDLYVKLADASGESALTIADSANTRVGYITSDGEAYFTANVNTGSVTANGNILPGTDDSVDLGSPNREFRNAYIDGTAHIDVLNVATGVAQGVAASLIPTTDAVGNLGSTTRKWGTVWADTTNGGSGVFNTVGVSSTLQVNGAVDINNDADISGQLNVGENIEVSGNGSIGGTFSVTGSTNLNGNVTLGDNNADVITVTGTFANQSTSGTAQFNGDTDIGSNSSDTLTVSAKVDSDLIPVVNDGDGHYELGTTSSRWNAVYANTAYANNISVDNNITVAGDVTVDGNINLSSGAAIAAPSGTYTTITVTGVTNLNGEVNLGDAFGDDINVNGYINTDIIPSAGERHNLGSSSSKWSTIYANNIVLSDEMTLTNKLAITKNLSVGGNTTISTNLDVGGTLTADGTWYNDAVVVVGKNAKLHANNTISNDTIQNSMIKNDHIRVAAESGSEFDIALGETFTIAAGEGIDTVLTANTVTISGEDATTSNKGIASFNTNDFTVSSGAVSIKSGGVSSTQLANTMTSGSTQGSSSQVPVITVNNKGQVIGISNTTVAGVTGLTYSSSNNNIRISTADGSTFDDVIDPATTSVKGVASFDSGDFDVSSGAVSLKNATTGAVLAVSGTANEVNVSRTNGTVTVGLPDDVTVAGQLNVGENVVVSGNLVVQGTTTTVNSETVNIADNIIVLNSNEAGTPSQNGGITIERGTSTNKSFLWNETSDKWTLGTDTLLAGTVEADLTGDVTGNADTADALSTARSIGISLSGDVSGSGSASFDGSGNITISATNMAVQNNSVDLGTHTTGNYVATIADSTGIDISGSGSENAAVTVSLDLSELTTSTTDGDGDYFVVVDTNSNQKKLTKANINISGFNNDSGFTTTTGTVTSHTVTAGDGLTGGGTVTTSGTTTLNIGAGAGIDVAADSISVESDLRGDMWQMGRDTNDYYIVNTTTHDWYLDGVLDMRLENDGDLHVDGDVVAYSTTTSSDRKLKENITNVENALDKVTQLNGVEFTWKKDGKLSAGVIAQDVEQVLPQAVKEVEDLNSGESYKTVKYDALHALLIESIKELKAEIDELKKNK